MQRHLLVGPGALGIATATAIVSAGDKLDILCRPEKRDAILRHGLRREGLLGQATIPRGQIHVCSSPPELSGGPYDSILVCTKACAAPATALQLSVFPRMVNDQTRIVLCINGWGVADAFVHLFGAHRVDTAVFMTGFILAAPTTSRITVHFGPVRIGGLYTAQGAPTTPLAETLTRGGLPTIAIDNVRRDVWAKLIFNCAVNALGAIHKMSIGALQATSSTSRLMTAIIREAFDVMHAAGYDTHHADADSYIRHFRENMVPKTHDHTTSMLQDIQAHRPTEIDYLNGAIVRLADRLRIDTPENAAVCSRIRRLEAGYVPVVEPPPMNTAPNNAMLAEGPRVQP
ncbi:MAG TPA: 2-dehydropantoate 2-reductase [Bryobacteraceae bacterium]|nr:2-dehydropantoate 2-reductase [Bryobacteraceae bacterium]